MGISTYMSYCGAQIFEAIGLNRALIDKYFRGTSSNVEGIGIFEVAEEAIRMHKQAFGNDPVLTNMLDEVPRKYLSINARLSPIASNICAPQ